MLEILGLAEQEADFSPSVGAFLPPAGAPALNRPAGGVDLLAPRLADVAQDQEDEVDTGRLIQRLWEAAQLDHAPPPEEWRPQDLTISPRSFRWWVLLLLVLLLAGGATLLVAATRIPQSQAAARAARYQTQLAEVAGALPAAQAAAFTVLSPATSRSSLSEAVGPLARLESAALDLRSVAAEPLPQPPPLVSHRAIDSLRPLRQQLLVTADQALTVSDRVTAVLDYRLLMGRAFRLPALPISATSEEIADLGVELAVALAETLDLLSQLPEEPLMADHRTRAEALAGELEVLQAEYLDALRREDVEAATALATDITHRVVEARDLAGALEEARGSTEEHFAEVERLLAEAEALLEAGP